MNSCVLKWKWIEWKSPRKKLKYFQIPLITTLKHPVYSYKFIKCAFYPHWNKMNSNTDKHSITVMKIIRSIHTWDITETGALSEINNDLPLYFHSWVVNASIKIIIIVCESMQRSTSIEMNSIQRYPNLNQQNLQKVISCMLNRAEYLIIFNNSRIIYWLLI